MSKFFLFLCFIVIFTSRVFAIGAYPDAIVYQQPDGYMLDCKMVGDEFFHYRRTLDGYALLANSDGYLTYAVKDSVGEMVASAVVAHNAGDRNNVEWAFLQTVEKSLSISQKTLDHIKSLRNSRRIKKIANTQLRSASIAPSKFLVILVNFSDKAFSIPTPLARYTDHFNSTNYITDGATGSVAKFFKDNSLNTFNPTFDVYGPVTLSQPMAYYGGNDASGNDLRPREMVSEACQLLNSQINFANYDTNSDGEVDNVFVIYAGYGEAAGGSANTIWPHAWTVSSNTKLDNKLIRSYSCSCELRGGSGTTIDGVGTACHEFSHVLGLPDMYDTDYETNGQSAAIGSWSVMGSGNYNNAGKTPPYYTSVERELLGWGTATVLNTATSVSIQSINNNTFYKINTNTPNEYFLLENRQQNGWDASLNGHGLLVYHIDKTASYLSRWSSNEINAFSDHNCVDLLEANSNVSISSGNPFPGSTNLTTLSDNTTPNLKSWANVATGKTLSSIAENAGVVTFTLTLLSQTSAIEEVTPNQLTITQNDSRVTVYSPVNDVVRIFDVMGRLVLQAPVAVGENHFDLAAHQMYVVHVGGVSRKILVK